jgi:hypothetical protein
LKDVTVSEEGLQFVVDHCVSLRFLLTIKFLTIGNMRRGDPGKVRRGNTFLRSFLRRKGLETGKRIQLHPLAQRKDLPTPGVGGSSRE